MNVAVRKRFILCNGATQGSTALHIESGQAARSEQAGARAGRPSAFGSAWGEHGEKRAQVHEHSGYPLAAVLRTRVDLVVEEVMVRIIFLPHLRVAVGRWDKTRVECDNRQSFECMGPCLPSHGADHQHLPEWSSSHDATVRRALPTESATCAPHSAGSAAPCRSPPAGR